MNYTAIDNAPGLYTSVDRNKKTIYYVRLFHNGKNYGYRNLTKLKGATSLTLARKAKSSILAMLDDGKNPFELHRAKLTLLDDYFLDYLNDIKSHSKKSIEGKKWFYNKHLKHLGKNAPSQITPKHIIDILNTTLNGKKWRTIKELTGILNIIFKKAEARGVYISAKNPFLDSQVRVRVDKIKEEVITPIGERLKIDLEPFVGLVYDEILAYKVDRKYKKWISHLETKIIMMIALMCARRRGEILQYRYENISSDGRIDVPASITKTNVKDAFPLPSVIVSMIGELREIKRTEDEGLIFTVAEEHMPTLHFRKVINAINEKENCIVKGEKITLHTCRHLFATIMAPYKGAILADLCISHLPPKMMRTYNNTPYNIRAEVFFEYWKILEQRKLSRV